jgi:hypothetical protein
MGVALSPCTVPAAGTPNFSIPKDSVAFGLGLYRVEDREGTGEGTGEPGGSRGGYKGGGTRKGIRR